MFQDLPSYVSIEHQLCFSSSSSSFYGVLASTQCKWSYYDVRKVSIICDLFTINTDKLQLNVNEVAMIHDKITIMCDLITINMVELIFNVNGVATMHGKVITINTLKLIE